ncbi:MAG: hydrogenase [Deltaproteobacteria bacterium]|nr:hydrogenase [Deltaproteobacteria bacterium]MBI4223920.1 hydrogenase [Deltaproteobacteria bacterium]
MDWLLVGVVLTAFVILGSSRLDSCIRMVALQGVLLSILPPMVRGSLLDWHGLFLAAASLAIKTVAIPVLLARSLKQAKIKREVEPTVSLHYSLLAGGAIVVIAFSGFKLLPVPTGPFPTLLIPAALTVVFIGFFLLISRFKAITQVIGFLVLENGVFLFGMTLIRDFPLTVEMGVLLDLWVGVFVMGIMIHHIHRTFDHIDTKAMASLKDAE